MSASMATAEPVPPLAHAVGGSLGSALALLLLYPLERVRIEMQSNVSKAGKTWLDEADDSNAECQAETIELYATEKSAAAEGRYKGKQPIICCFEDLMKRGELYKGVKPIVATLAASNFVFFFMNEIMKRLLLKPEKRDTIQSLRLLLASCLAGVVNVLLTNPLWVTNLRIVSGSTETDSLFTELLVVAKKGGVPHLYKGTSTSILLVSNPVIQFFSYEQMKNYTGRRSSPLDFFVMGALAKTLATVLTYPLQLTQAVLRMDQEGTKRGENEAMYRGSLDCLVKLYKSGGVPELFTGMKAKLLQTVLTASFTFLTYEQIIAVVAIAIRSSQRDRATNR